MENLYTILRYLHILAGSIALMSGPIAMLNQNGGTLHRISGKIYFFSMLFIFTSSIVLAIHTGKIFLLMIGVMSLILVSSGYRALYLKKLNRGQKPALIDWMIVIIAAICGISLCCWGFHLLYFIKSNFGIVAIVFGSLLLRGVRTDYRRFTKPSPDKNDWLYKHISNMVAGYIATFTAFLVQNLDWGFIVWLLPTFVFLPFIIYTNNKFRKKSATVEQLLLEIKK